MPALLAAVHVGINGVRIAAHVVASGVVEAVLVDVVIILVLCLGARGGLTRMLQDRRVHGLKGVPARSGRVHDDGVRRVALPGFIVCGDG